MSNEQQFLHEDGILVTQARFVVPGQTFAMSGVTSVAGRTVPPSRLGPVVLILVGLPLIALFGAGLLLIAAGIWWLLSQKPTHSVILRSVSGEATAYSSTDAQLTSRIIDALTGAIVARG